MDLHAFDRLLLRDIVDRLDILLPEDHGRDLGLDAGLPIALLPVRLEARFFAHPAGDGRTLQVRIIPDDIHVPTLETGITEREAALANLYREAEGEDARAAAWGQLVSGAGTSTPRILRAAWLVSLAAAGPVVPRERAPLTARGLPDNWYVVAYAGDRVVASTTSAPVAADLTVDPLADADSARWLTDFPTALELGMAVELEVGADPLDVLLAVGVRSGPDGSAGAGELAAILEAQFHSRDVDLLAPGTPTNNTGAARAAWRSTPDVGEIHRRTVAEPVGSVPDTDGFALSSAFGLPADTPALSRPIGAGTTAQRDAGAMVDLLWPITGGELLDSMLSDVGSQGRIGARVSEAARDHASRFVRGRGPLPTILVGRQPYGVLPALSLSRWVPETGSVLAGLRRRLLTGWALWEDAVRGLPRLGGANDDGNATKLIAELMCQSPVPEPTGYKATKIFPPLYSLTLPFLPLGGALDADLTAGMLDLPWLPILGVAREDTSKLGSIVLPAVDPEGGASLHSAGGAAGGLLAMAHADLGRPDLLSQLTRRALLRAGERAAADVGVALAEKFAAPEVAITIKGALINDLGIVNPMSPLAYTVRDVMPEAVAAIADRTLAEFIAEPSAFADAFLETKIPLPPSSPEYDAAVAAIDHLAGLRAEQLELLLGETLDVFSNRYDAWVTSLATRRLREARTTRPEGVHLGAFGWLVDLEPGRVPPAGADHVLAPSPAHAATAAVLRHADIDDRASSIDGSNTARRFDLTSASVRIARGILEAVGQGQPLSAVLGYRIERFLQDERMIPTIPALRTAFGTFAGEVPPDAGHPAETIPAHDVVDGVAVWRALDAGTPIAGVSPPVHEKLGIHVFSIMDALSDLVVAEGVHQIVRGDRTRAGATITALSRGVPPPAELRVVDSPGRHLAVPVQLLMAVGAGEAPASSGWADDRPRARVAPAAERLARSLLPDPADCGFVLGVDAAGAGDDAGADAPTVSLDALGLCALDVLAEVGADDEHSPLASRVRYAVGEAAARARLLPDAAPGTALGWGAVTALARTWARVFGSARPLLPGDVSIAPEEGAPRPAPPDRSALESATVAARTVVQRLLDAARDLEERVAALGTDAPGPGFVADVAASLEVFRSAGLAGTAQEPGSGASDILALARRCVAAGVTAGQRWQRLDAAPETDHPSIAGRPGADDVSELTERLAATVRDIFGEVVVAAPEILAPGLVVRPSDVVAQLPSSDELGDWLGELSEVRTATRRWWQGVLATEAVAGSAPTLLPSQLPSTDEDWIGGFAGSPKKWRPPFGVRRAFVTQVAERIAGDALSALVVESWLEQVPVGFENDPHNHREPADGGVPAEAKVPGNQEPVGLATHYNASGARPPQSILLAVSPDPAVATWRLGDLVATLLETLELSRFRAIEPPTDLPSRSVLPAVFVPDGIAGVSFPSKLLERIEALDAATLTIHARRFGDD